MNNQLKLKQPKKYAHQSLTKTNKKEQQQQQQQEVQNEQTEHLTKTKKIQKQKNMVYLPKKVINKKNQPSALRLQAINQTFQKIQQNTQQMVGSFKIDSQLLNSFLKYDKKVKCRCQPGRNIKYYCLKCMQKNPQLQWPQVNLPLQVTVIHHSSEKVNKSSILPIFFISPQIKLQTFGSTTKSQQILKEINKQETWILFPHKSSKKVSQVKKDKQTIKNIVILDCTWFQTDQLITCLQKKGITNFIRLQDYESLYWRYNHHSDKALSSAQALAYFLHQYMDNSIQGSQAIKTDKHKYDNIMFLYLMNLRIVQNSLKTTNDKGNQAQFMEKCKQGDEKNQIHQQQERMDNN